jgi:hypothetical protein
MVIKKWRGTGPARIATRSVAGRVCASEDGEKVRETKIIQHWKWKPLWYAGRRGYNYSGPLPLQF